MEDYETMGAKQDASVIARKIGDEEWKKGNTKYALEAWEAAGITAAELLELARKLLEAEQIFEEWRRADRATEGLPSGRVDVRGHHCSLPWYCKRDECIMDRTRMTLLERYGTQIMDLLGMRVGRVWINRADSHIDPNSMRPAAVACLKMIKRMST